MQSTQPQQTDFAFGGLPPTFDKALEKDTRPPYETNAVHSITALPQYADNERSQQISPAMLCWEFFQQQNGYVLTNEELNSLDVRPPGPFVSPLLMEYSQYKQAPVPARSSFGPPAQTGFAGGFGQNRAF